LRAKARQGTGMGCPPGHFRLRSTLRLVVNTSGVLPSEAVPPLPDSPKGDGGGVARSFPIIDGTSVPKGMEYPVKGTTEGVRGDSRGGLLVGAQNLRG
jgi:hypothetical protein